MRQLSASPSARGAAHRQSGPISRGRSELWRDRSETTPIAHRLQAPAIQTARRGELRAATRTNRLRFKYIERFPAFAAQPKGALGRGALAGRTGESVVTRRPRGPRQDARLEQTSPAIQKN